MKYAAALLSVLALATTVPAIADARPDHGGRMGGGGRGERMFGGGEGRGRPDRAVPYGRNPFDRPPAQGPYGREPYGPPPRYDRRNHPANSLGADWRQQQDEARQGVRQGRYVPLGRVLPELRRRSPGRQLDAGLERGFDGRPVYRVRWGAANGRRIDYIIDAQTGQVIGVER